MFEKFGKMKKFQNKNKIIYKESTQWIPFYIISKSHNCINLFSDLTRKVRKSTADETSEDEITEETSDDEIKETSDHEIKENSDNVHKETSEITEETSDHEIKETSDHVNKENSDLLKKELEEANQKIRLLEMNFKKCKLWCFHLNMSNFNS